MKKQQMNRKKIIELVFAIILSFTILSILLYFLFSFYQQKKWESSIQQMQEISHPIFALDKIILYSSANAINTSNSALLDLDISQFTDIAIFINNFSDTNYTLENTIKELSIDSISFSPMPNQGNPTLYSKNLNRFGIPENTSEKESIQESFSFPIVESKNQIDYSKNEVSRTCSTPIVLEYINQNIVTKYHLPSDSNPSLDGSLLRTAGISLSSIETSLSFRIHIMNGLGEHFICPITIPISLHDEENKKTIYDGSYTQELNNLQNYTFLKQID